MNSAYDVILQTESSLARTEEEVAVCVTVYNNEAYVLQALDSVREQTWQPLRLMVMDSASTDGSLALAEQWVQQHADRFGCVEVGRLKTNSGGPGRPRNQAVTQAQTNFFLPLDADNMLYPRCIERLWESLSASSAAFAYPILEKFGRETGLLGTDPWSPAYLAQGNYIDALALIRTSAWAEVGGYTEDPRLLGLEDYDLWLNFAKGKKWGVQVPEILARYRVRSDSMSAELHEANDRGMTSRLAVIQEKHAWMKFD
jgi:glycosyltransferase involved in cell wall biosynthesis